MNDSAPTPADVPPVEPTSPPPASESPPPSAEESPFSMPQMDWIQKGNPPEGESR